MNVWIRVTLSVCVFFSLTQSYAQNIKSEVSKRRTTDSLYYHIVKTAYSEMSQDDVIGIMDNLPSFGIFKDNYIITGIPMTQKVTKHNADIKFQISIKQRVTKSILPFNTFLMLTYTQKSYWDVYAKSSPFRDNNFNPGIMLARAIIIDNKLKGMTYFSFEHESNGKDGIDSRSWNYLVLSGSYYLNPTISIQAKIWGGWVGEELTDFYDYRGFGQVVFNYRSTNERLHLSFLINPRRDIWKINTQIECSYRFNKNANQYCFVQWYQGYCENLLEYNLYKSMIRVGMCIKPQIRSYY